MNSVNINDEKFLNSEDYRNFIAANPKQGSLKIRAYAASQAVPISGLGIVVSKNIGNNNVIFFEGFTNESGVIENITLPAPLLDTNNMNIPNSTSYDITATYEPDNIKQIYKVNMYEGIYVIQNITIVPNFNVRTGGI